MKQNQGQQKAAKKYSQFKSPFSELRLDKELVRTVFRDDVSNTQTRF